MRITKLIFSVILLFAASTTLAMTSLRIKGRVKGIEAGRAIVQTAKGEVVRIKMSKLPESERKRITKAIASKEEFQIVLVPSQIAKD